MAERKTIAFRVDESQKQKWKKYAENNPEYDSLSHLVRLAVVHEMSDRYGRAGSGGGVDSGKIGELVTAVQKVEGRLEEVEKNVEDATEAAYSTAEPAAEIPPKGEILSALPHGKNNAMTADAIAVELGIDNAETALMLAYELERLEGETSAVGRIVESEGEAAESWAEAMAGGGATVTKRYYREE
ncbi:hypothetical protein DJ83_13750 [Halorubrum ezzemoulense]|uniref:Uncharacterized protein n=1 Tax=Halorubrum ezzemoulense TaxID=337243 RepID=A0A256IR83_HALEZ|nr:hypothetical protein [Halorubrum ezzemoulense]OYR59054.1 hypothetical protein DJ83_13750 [Halorubrum ezzemoulense]